MGQRTESKKKPSQNQLAALTKPAANMPKSIPTILYFGTVTEYFFYLDDDHQKASKRQHLHSSVVMIIATETQTTILGITQEQEKEEELTQKEASPPFPKLFIRFKK